MYAIVLQNAISPLRRKLTFNFAIVAEFMQLKALYRATCFSYIHGYGDVRVLRSGELELKTCASNPKCKDGEELPCIIWYIVRHTVHSLLILLLRAGLLATVFHSGFPRHGIRLGPRINMLAELGHNITSSSIRSQTEIDARHQQQLRPYN